MFRTLNISASGMMAQRLRIDTIAGNIANVNTTQNEDGEARPFQRRMAIMETDGSTRSATGGVGVLGKVEIDEVTPPRIQHQPGHPQADAEGNVHYPNVDVVTEFVNAIEASRAYDANIAAMDTTKQMFQGTFKILG